MTNIADMCIMRLLIDNKNLLKYTIKNTPNDKILIKLLSNRMNYLRVYYLLWKKMKYYKHIKSKCKSMARIARKSNMYYIKIKNILLNKRY